MSTPEADETAAALAHRRQAEYFSALSHELRTPLNGMLGYASLLLEGHYGALAEPQARAVNEIQGAARGLLGVLESLLAFSKAARGRALPQPAAFTVGDVMERLAARLAPLATAKSLTMLSDLEPAVLESDESAVEQIITNFLGNAIKFTPKGGSIRLVCKKLAETQAIELGVADTGLGIALEDRKRIFEPFVQLESAGVRQQGGTGLGLALSRTHASLLQGVIGFAPNVPQGSYFFTLLPLTLCLPADAPMAYEAFVERVRQAQALARRVPNQFALLQLAQLPADGYADLRRFTGPSDLVARRDETYYVGLHGAEPVAAQMVAERLKNMFLYERQANVRCKIMAFEDVT